LTSSLLPVASFLILLAPPTGGDKNILFDDSLSVKML